MFEYRYRRGLRELDLHRKRIMTQGRFLVFQFRQIGDVLLTLPMIQAIKRHVPDATIGFCTERAALPFVEASPFVDKIFLRKRGEGFFSDMSLVRDIRTFRPDVIIDAIKLPSSGWISLFSHAPVRIAFDHPIRRYFYTITLVPRLTCGYTLDEKLVLLEGLGMNPFEGNFRDMTLRVDATADSRVVAFLRENDLDCGQPLIVIAPTHRRLTRRWPAEHYSRLIDLLWERLKARSIIVWGPGEESYSRQVHANTRIKPVVFFDSSLLELTALIRRSHMLIGNDSAPRHIAVSQGTPSIAIHGSTGIDAWTPPLPEHIAWSLQASCQPCNKNTCKTLECLNLLTPEKIIDGIVEHFHRFARVGSRI